MQRAVDGNHVTLREHILKVLNTAATNFFLYFGAKRLVVVVKELLAVKGLKTTQNTLANAADSDGTDDLVLKIILVLGHGSDIPVATADLFVRRNKVANQGKNGHDDVFSDRNNIATSDFGDSDTTVGLVGSVKVNMV